MYRRIQTSLWEDGWFTDLSADEKLLYLYFVTGPTQRKCGVFKMNARRVQFDTGIAHERLRKAIDRLWPHVLFHAPSGHLAVFNFMKHQDCGAKWRKSANDQYEGLPEDVKAFLLDENKKAIDSLSKGYATGSVAVTGSEPDTEAGTDSAPPPATPVHPLFRDTPPCPVIELCEEWNERANTHDQRTRLDIAGYEGPPTPGQQAAIEDAWAAVCDHCQHTAEKREARAFVCDQMDYVFGCTQSNGGRTDWKVSPGWFWGKDRSSGQRRVLWLDERPWGDPDDKRYAT